MSGAQHMWCSVHVMRLNDWILPIFILTQIDSVNVIARSAFFYSIIILLQLNFALFSGNILFSCISEDAIKTISCLQLVFFLTVIFASHLCIFFLNENTALTNYIGTACLMTGKASSSDVHGREGARIPQSQDEICNWGYICVTSPSAFHFQSCGTSARYT